MKLPRIICFSFSLVLVAHSMFGLFKPSSLVKAAQQFDYASLSGVACLPDGFCMAVGSYEENSYKRPLVITKQNGNWAKRSAPQSTDKNYLLNAVSCTSASFCVAVGQKYSQTDQAVAWISVYESGIWREAVVGGVANGLNSISCSSQTFCMAGGWRQQSNRSYAVGYTFSAGQWAAVNLTPAEGGNLTSSLDVNCIADGVCSFSAGYSKIPTAVDNSTYALGVFEHGQISLLPNLSPDEYGVLNAHDCVTLEYCAATSVNFQGFEKTLAEYSNGAWQQTEQSRVSPNSDLQDPNFNDIACSSSKQCISAGQDRRPINSFEPYAHALVVTRTEVGWESQIIEPANAYTSTLKAVSCVSPTSCVAVGSYGVSGRTSQPMIATLAGGTWTVTDPFKEAFSASLVMGTQSQRLTPGTPADLEALLISSMPIQASVVRFAIISGPCKGNIKYAQTDAGGKAHYKYSCPTVGKDHIEAKVEITDSYGTVHELVAQTWLQWRHQGSAYVAFGDSLTTGGSILGCKPNREISPWGCTENPTSAIPYPAHVANLAGFKANELQRVGIWGDTAQEAARAKETGRNSQGPWQPQLQAVETATELVTGSLGSNDLRFSDVAFWIKKYYSPGSSQVVPAARAILHERSKDFDEMFKSLQQAKQNGAEVVVALYYNPYDSANRFCGDLENIGDQLVDTLDAELARRAHQNGLKTADFRPSFNGHGSGTIDAYVFGTQCKASSAIADWLPSWLGGGGGREALAVGFDPHPNDKGTKAMAQIIKEAIR